MDVSFVNKDSICDPNDVGNSIDNNIDGITTSNNIINNTGGDDDMAGPSGTSNREQVGS